MNAEHTTDVPSLPDDRERHDAVLTAHALGQVTGAEREAVERLLAEPSAEADRRHVADMRRLGTALRAGLEEVGSPEDGGGRSPELRRAVVAALAAAGGRADGRPAPTPPTPSDRYVRWLLAAGGVAAALAITVVVRPPAGEPAAPRADALRRAGPRGAADELAEAAAAAAPAPYSTPASAPAGAAPDRLAGTAIHAERQVREQAGADRSPASRRDQPIAAKESKPQEMGKAIAATASPRGTAAGAANGVAPALPGAPLAEPAAGGLAVARPTSDEQVLQRQLARGRTVEEESLLRGDADRHHREQIRGPVHDGREDTRHAAAIDGERYERIVENGVFIPAEQPLSTFSIDVDTASYANVRRFLAAGRLPPRDAVRIEELVNSFRYDYPRPGGDDPFSVTVDAAACPWHAGRRLVRVGLQGRDVDRRERPAGNLVFLVDVSGSMDAPAKLPLVKQALAMLVEELTASDSVAIVTYAGDAGLRLPATGGDQKARILEAIESLAAGGATHGSAGITLAYEQAAARFVAGGVNRVILATDGDLNVGITSDEALVELIRRQAAGGTFLTVLGFGDGNLQDAKMEKLADNGNGFYAYIDGAREARKVLVEQLTGSTITIAKDVKIQVEFNPARVASYRLLGYENRVLGHADFRDDRKDAGEIGAGHSVTALYEITLADDAAAAAGGAEPLRYRPQPPAPAATDAARDRELLTVKLRWKRPDGDRSVLREVPLTDAGAAFSAAPADFRFAAAVAAFGMILRGSDRRGEATLPLVAAMAAGSLGRDEGGYRAEFLDLVRRAGTLGGADGPR